MFDHPGGGGWHRLGGRRGLLIAGAALVVLGGLIYGGYTALQHRALGTDTALTPKGWAPVAVGTVQISVPRGWPITGPAPGNPCHGGRNIVVLNPRGSSGAKLCSSEGNVVSIFRSSGASVPRRRSERIARELGYVITATGPLAKRIMATLTHSPEFTVLHSHAGGTPSTWRRVSFGGLRFSVPKNWRVFRSSIWPPCPYNLLPDRLTLVTAGHFNTNSCLAVPRTAGLNAGQPAVLIGSGPLVRQTLTATGLEQGATCRSREGLRICVDAPSGWPYLGIMTAQISLPGQENLDQFEIGLSGTGKTAARIFDSLRPAA